MKFLRGLFSPPAVIPASSRFLTYQVRPKRCSEVVEVRIDTMNDPSLLDDGGFFVRKVARGERCPFPAELHVTFNGHKTVIDVKVIDGELVE